MTERSNKEGGLASLDCTEIHYNFSYSLTWYFVTLPGHTVCVKVPTLHKNLYMNSSGVEDVKSHRRQTFPTMWAGVYQIWNISNSADSSWILYFISSVRARPVKPGSSSLLNKSNFKVKRWKMTSGTWNSSSRWFDYVKRIPASWMDVELISVQGGRNVCVCLHTETHTHTHRNFNFGKNFSTLK